MGTHYDGTDDEVLALDAYIKLMRCTSVLTAQLQRSLKERGLTVSQLGVLEALHHLGPMCQRDVGRKLLLSGGNITTVVNNLEKRGLVRRVRGQEDRRYVQLQLTDAGMAFIADLFPGHAERIAGLMGGLDADELQQFGELARKLGRSIEDAG